MDLEQLKKLQLQQIQSVGDVPPTTTPEVGTTTSTPNEPAAIGAESTGSLMDYVPNVPKALAAGVERSGRGLYETVDAGANLIGADLPDLPEATFKTSGVGENLIAGVTELGLSYLTGRGVLSGVKAVQKLSGGVKFVAESAVGQALTSDPNHERLSDLLQTHPSLQNPVAAFLEQDPTDSKAVSKAKAALEDVLANSVGAGVAHILAGSFSKILEVKRLYNLGKTTEAEALSKTMAPELQKLTDVQNGKGIWNSTKLPGDYSGIADVAGNQMSKTVGKTKTSDLLHTRTPEEMLTPEFRAKVDEFKEALQKNPSEVPVILKEELADGTTRSLGDARLVAAKELGIDEVPTVNFHTAETAATKEAAAVKWTAPTTGKVVFSATQDQLKNVTQHIADAIELNKLDDVFDSKEFRAWNHRSMDVSADAVDTVEALTKQIAPKLKLDEVQTHEQVRKAAQMFGVDQTELEGRLSLAYQGTKDLAATIVAAKGYALAMSRDIANLTQRVKNGVATQAEQEALPILIQKTTNLAGMTRGIIRGAARGTSAGNIKLDSEFLNKLGLLTPEELPKALAAKTFGRQTEDKINEWWLSAMLSGPATHERNFLGSMIQSTVRPTEMMVGGVMSGDWKTVREGKDLLVGLFTNQRNAVKVAGRAWKEDRAILDPGHSSDDVVIKNLGGPEQATKELLKNPATYYNAYVSLTFRTLKGTDEYWKQLNYSSSLNVIARREADKLISEKSLDPSKVDDFMNEFIAKGYDATGAAVNAEALSLARTSTFTDPIDNPLIRGIQNAKNADSAYARIPAKVLAPFITVPTNIVKSSFDLTPAFMLSKRKFWDEVNSEDPLKRALALGRLNLAQSFTSAVFKAASEGTLTGGGPSDFQLRKKLMESGWQPYSVRTTNPDGTHTYVSLASLGPFSVSIMTLLEIQEGLHNTNGREQENFASLAAQSLISIVHGLSDQSFFGSVRNVLEAIHDEKGLDAKRFFHNLGGSMVPNWLKAFNDDTEMKQIRSMSDSLRAKVPALSEAVEAKRNYFGEKMYQPLAFPWNALTPTKISRDKQAADVELGRLSSIPGATKFNNPPTKIPETDIDLTELRNEKGQTAYDRLMELKSEVKIGDATFREAFTNLIKTERYKNGTDGDTLNTRGSRDEMVSKLSKQYLDKAKDQMIREFNLGQTIQDKKQAKKDMKKGVVKEQSSTPTSRTETQINDLIEFGN